ncbi:glycosyl hydrolase [Xylogone sp. PMI_703]|nr:glycosyl hydrolase [Xylogone sp. PMI_703]
MTTITNPIIPGFAPDPSVVFVDGTFYLVNSSFHVFPGLPIYASKNLKDWALIEQLDLSNSRAAPILLPTGYTMVALGGLFAASIRHHNGIFYVICTNAWFADGQIGLRNFYVKTSGIWSDEWSDPITFDFHGIDPSLFFDDDGRAYVQGSWSINRNKQPSCTIKQFEINIETGEILSPTEEIWGGFAQYDTEGPHIYKRDGYYYLMVAEGGTFEHHSLSIARSRNIWGPYESFKNNPILTADGTNEYIQNTGHGELFQDGDGLWWAVVVGHGKPDGRRPLGRETFLTEVDWPRDGWPVFKNPRMTMERAEARVLSVVNDLVTPKKDLENLHIRYPVLENYTISNDGSRIGIRAGTSDLSSPVGPTSFVGRRQRSLDCTAGTTLIISSSQKAKTIRAGLAAYKEDLHHAEIFYDYDTATICFFAVNKVKGTNYSEQRPLDFVNSVSLEIRATPNSYDFIYFDETGKQWMPFGSIDTLDLSGHDITGALFGIFAVAAAEDEGIEADFRNFAIRHPSRAWPAGM